MKDFTSTHHCENQEHLPGALYQENSVANQLIAAQVKPKS